MRDGRIRNLLLLCADGACLAVSWAAVVTGYYLVGGDYEPLFYLRMWPVVPLWLGLNVLFRLYHGRVFYPAAPFSPVEEMRRLVGSAILVHVFVVAVLAFAKQSVVGYSRMVIVMSGILTAVLSQPVRDLVRYLMKGCGVGQIPVVLVGDPRTLCGLVKIMRGSAYIGYSPIGYFSDDGAEFSELKRLGGAADVVRMSMEKGVRVLVVCEDVLFLRRRLHEFSGWFTHIAYFPKDIVLPVAGSRTVVMDGIGGVEMVNQARMSVLRVEKWIVDKSLAVLVFVLTLPLLVVIGALVVLTSRGGVFFMHERLGRNGRPIRIWKFRTMYRDAAERLNRILAEDSCAAEEWHRNFKLKNDPRVTPLGRFLRKTSLDELPQLFNVLGGSMALVGPRPIVEEEKSYYGEQYALFSSVKPGMTGLWQVSGRSDTDYARRVALDVFYILNWSPWMDIWILIRTTFAVVLMRGAR